MGLYHCLLGVPYYDGEGCIDCGMCNARNKDEMIEASKKVREYLQTNQQTSGPVKKIAVCGKGGAGKSTVVTLLAKTFQEEGCSVLVIDTDESNPGLHRLLGLDREPAPLFNLMNNIDPDEDPEIDWLKNDRLTINDIPGEYITAKKSLRFLVTGKIEDPLQGCACSMANITRKLVEILTVSEKEIIIIDTAAGVESFGRGVERCVDTVIAAVEPSFQSMELTKKINFLSTGLGISRIRTILNKVTSIDCENKMTEMLQKGGANIIGSISQDSELSSAAFEGREPGKTNAMNEMRTIVQTLLVET